MNHKDPFENTDWIPFDKDQDQAATIVIKNGVVKGISCELTDDVDLNTRQVDDIIDAMKEELTDLYESIS